MQQVSILQVYAANYICVSARVFDVGLARLVKDSEHSTKEGEVGESSTHCDY